MWALRARIKETADVADNIGSVLPQFDKIEFSHFLFQTKWRCCSKG